jgi:hypothetical protein
LHKSTGAAVERGRGVTCRYECSSETEVRNDQLERLQYGAEGTWFSAHLAGQGHVLARQCKRQARPPSAVQRGGDPVLPDHQGLVQACPGSGDGHSTKSVPDATRSFRLPKC